MQELTMNDIEQANGGILPLVGFALSLAGKVSGSAGVIGWGISSASLVLGSFEAAKYLGSLKES